jgi:hypothetical protein
VPTDKKQDRHGIKDDVMDNRRLSPPEHEDEQHNCIYDQKRVRVHLRLLPGLVDDYRQLVERALAS